jgi:heat shock protein HtpX
MLNFNEKIALKMSRAKEVSWGEKPRLHTMVEKLAAKAGVPKPKIYIVPGETPNAFASGCNFDNAAIAVTDGLLRVLYPEQREVFLTRELALIKKLAA